MYAHMLFLMYQIFVTQNVYLEHSVQIARQIVKDIVEIHVITLVECATADVKMVGWDHTAINVSKYIYMIKTTAFLENCIAYIFCVLPVLSIHFMKTLIIRFKNFLTHLSKFIFSVFVLL